MFLPENFFSKADNKREAELLQRLIDFGKDAEYEEKFEQLTDENKAIVYNVLDSLTGGCDNWGYNFKMILDKFRMPFINEANDSENVSYEAITRRLFDDKRGYWNSQVLEVWDSFLDNCSNKNNISVEKLEEQFANIAECSIKKRVQDTFTSSYYKEPVEITKNKISKLREHCSEIEKDFPEIWEKLLKTGAIVTAQNENEIKSFSKKLLKPFLDTVSNYTFIRIICEYYGVDMELVKNGIGKVYDINPLYYEDLRDTMDDDDDLFHDYYGTTAITPIQIARAYEEYLREDEALKDGQPVVITRWGIINTSGKYLMLNEESMRASSKEKKNVKRDAIKTLIDSLLERNYA